jgi:hypothetical protein
MDRFYEQTAADFGHGYTAHLAHVYGDVPGQECENCGTTRGTVERIHTDDGRKPLLCEDCAEEVRRLEKLADRLAVLPGCEARERIIDTCQTTEELVNRLQAHDMAQCAACALCASGKAA